MGDDAYFLFMEEEGARGLVEKRREREEEINVGIVEDEKSVVAGEKLIC